MKKTKWAKKRKAKRGGTRMGMDSSDSASCVPTYRKKEQH